MYTWILLVYFKLSCINLSINLKFACVGSHWFPPLTRTVFHYHQPLEVISWTAVSKGAYIIKTCDFWMRYHIKILNVQRGCWSRFFHLEDSGSGLSYLIKKKNRQSLVNSIFLLRLLNRNFGENLRQWRYLGGTAVENPDIWIYAGKRATNIHWHVVFFICWPPRCPWSNPSNGVFHL